MSGFALKSLDVLIEAIQAIEAQYIEYVKKNEITLKRSWQIEMLNLTLDLAKRDLFVGASSSSLSGGNFRREALSGALLFVMKQIQDEYESSFSRKYIPFSYLFVGTQNSALYQLCEQALGISAENQISEEEALNLLQQFELFWKISPRPLRKSTQDGLRPYFLLIKETLKNYLKPSESDHEKIDSYQEQMESTPKSDKELDENKIQILVNNKINLLNHAIRSQCSWKYQKKALVAELNKLHQNAAKIQEHDLPLAERIRFIEYLKGDALVQDEADQSLNIGFFKLEQSTSQSRKLAGQVKSSSAMP